MERKRTLGILSGWYIEVILKSTPNPFHAIIVEENFTDFNFSKKD